MPVISGQEVVRVLVMVGAGYISELERPSSMKQKEVGEAWAGE